MALTVPTLAEMNARGETAEVLFWLGCAGSFDDRAKRITKAIARILHAAEVPFAVLGAEESCTGDPAKRAGNEFLFQMQAAQNISGVLSGAQSQFMALLALAALTSVCLVVVLVSCSLQFAKPRVV